MHVSFKLFVEKWADSLFLSVFFIIFAALYEFILCHE